jgi:hypothetical protein
MVVEIGRAGAFRPVAGQAPSRNSNNIASGKGFAKNGFVKEHRMKRILLAGLLALVGMAEIASAQPFGRGRGWGPSYGPAFGPPPPPYSAFRNGRCPSPRHVFVPGYYRWQGNRYRWVDGYWAVPPRHRAAWVPGYWTPRNGVHVWIDGFRR